MDLLGGGAMGLFYILSGFVMMVGYAQKPLRPPTREEVRNGEADTLCCSCC